jgi:hypothetical protein
MIEDLFMGWVMGRFIVGVFRSVKRHWKVWLAAYLAFLIYRHFVLGVHY